MISFPILRTGFLIGFMFQVLINGPHVGCCHTVRTILIGGTILGTYSMILHVLTNYLVTYLVINPLLGGVSNFGSNLLTFGLTITLFSKTLCLYDNWQIRQLTERTLEQASNKENFYQLKRVDGQEWKYTPPSTPEAPIIAQTPDQPEFKQPEASIQNSFGVQES